jgi:hypothetical protein
MTVPSPAPAGQAPRRNLATVAELAEAYRQPRSTLYDMLRRTPGAGVLRIGRRIMVDVDIFDNFISRHGRPGT